MEFPNQQQDADTPEQVNPPELQRSQTELRQQARDIVADRDLLAYVLDAAGLTPGPMAPEERKSKEGSDPSHSPPPMPHLGTYSLASQSYLHSPHPSSPHHQAPQSPLQEGDNVTEEGMALQTSAYERSGHTTTQQPTLGGPIICQSPTEDYTTSYPTANRTEPGQPTPGHHIPGLFTPHRQLAGVFTHGQFTNSQPTPGHYTEYQPAPGQYTTDYPTPGSYTPGYPTPNQNQYIPSQYPTHHPTSNQYPTSQPPPARETEEERKERELREYIDHGYDEEMKEEHPEHFMHRLPDGTWALRED